MPSFVDWNCSHLVDMDQSRGRKRNGDMRGLSEFVRVSSCGLAEAAEGAPEAFADFIRAEYEKWGR